MATKRPARLGPRGKRFWDYVTDTFDLEREDRELLGEVCRTLDVLETLDYASAHADDATQMLTFQREARQQRLALGRMLGQLALPDEDGAGLITTRQRAAQKAAQSRWRNTPADRHLSAVKDPS
jgi:hypothetical protein